MLKRSLLVLGLVGCLATVSSAADFELAYDTRHMDGPHWLDKGVPTPLEISLVNNTQVDFPIGGIVFDFSSTGYPLTWDLDGIDDTGLTGDDDFAWTSWLNGDPHPVYSAVSYFATVDPPQTALQLTDMFAVTVPAMGSTHVATLMVTSPEGPGYWETELKAGVEDNLLFHGEAGGFAAVLELGGTNVVTLVPEPATLALMVIGGLATLRRRR